MHHCCCVTVHALRPIVVCSLCMLCLIRQSLQFLHGSACIAAPYLSALTTLCMLRFSSEQPDYTMLVALAFMITLKRQHYHLTWWGAYQQPPWCICKAPCKFKHTHLDQLPAGLPVRGGSQGVSCHRRHQGSQNHQSLQGRPLGASQGNGVCHICQHSGQVTARCVAVYSRLLLCHAVLYISLKKQPRSCADRKTRHTSQCCKGALPVQGRL